MLQTFSTHVFADFGKHSTLPCSRAAASTTPSEEHNSSLPTSDSRTRKALLPKAARF